jgi:hypothetical protein
VKAARSLVKLGRLVEASERYLAVTRMLVAPDALKLQRDAVTAAAKERAELLPRIGAIVATVSLIGARPTQPDPSSEVVVTIDGAAVPAALLGANRSIDPGKHHVEAKLQALVAARDVEVGEGAVVAVPLELDVSSLPDAPRVEPPPASKPIVVLPPAPPPTLAPTPAVIPDDSRGVSGRAIAGWLLVGFGSASLTAGAIVGGAAIAKRSDLRSECGAELECPPPFHADSDEYNRLRVASAASIYVGAAIGISGVVVLATAPKRRAAKALAIVPVVGPTFAGIAGRFE